MESGSTQEEVKEGENGGIIPTAHRHSLTLQLISGLPLPSMPDETGVETPEQTHWTVVYSIKFWYLLLTADLSAELCES